METLSFGDPTTSLLLALTVTGTGVLLAGVAYVALSGKRLLALAICAALPVLAATAAYFAFLTVFHQLDVSGQEIRLRYFNPARTIVLTRDDVERVERRKEGGRGATTYNLIVHGRDGKSYISANARLQDIEPAAARLREWLASPGESSHAAE